MRQPSPASDRGRVLLAALTVCIVCALARQATAAAIPAAQSLAPNLEGSIARPLRYRPEGTDFVVSNGREFFNRPLYGGNTAFRVDAGDRPEFVLYLPGRGGNLRLGLRTGGRAVWLHDLAKIDARYRPGSMLYDIRDPDTLGDGVLRLSAIALRDTEGLVIRAGLEGAVAPVELFWAYGGVNGQRGRRDGDIGTESVPISEWFQLRPESCRENVYTLDDSSFTLEARPGRILGLFPPGSRLALADATSWSSPDALAQSTNGDHQLPVVIGHVALENRLPVYLALQRLPRDGDASTELQTYRDVRRDGPDSEAAIKPAMPTVVLTSDSLPAAFERAERQRMRIASQLRIETPDPFINAAVAALNVGADAVWDEPQGAVMHGAIAWRSKLLGWRGPYAMDALGWHDRARRHLAYWATRQNLDPIPEALPPPEEETNLARSRTALHSNGNLSNSHYDMNLVYIDALFRHLQWTGDLDFAREVWPVIERHLAWERRMFRREFGREKLPLYEAYAAIWASDDLQYHGGGVAYASAYNFWHNRMAARLARLLGHNPVAYETESRLIARAMRELLWMPGAGMFAEFKDLLGEQLVHPSAGLWSFYHVVDSELPTPADALAMTWWVDANIPQLPILGDGVPADRGYYVLSTTNWMPYTWSVNNVVMGENLHAALAYWQAGRSEEAFCIAKASLLASMFMGICPGNVGSMNYLDVYRRESQRDFADGSGVLSRALVEGLFGVRPDLLDGRVTIAPGFPSDWDHASLQHAGVGMTFTREGSVDRYVIEPRFPKPTALRFVLSTRGEAATVKVNGRRVEGDVAGARPVSAIEIHTDTADRWTVEVSWTGSRPSAAGVGRPEMPGPDQTPIAGVPAIDWHEQRPATTRLEPIDLSARFNDRITDIFQPGMYRSPRSPYVSLAIPAQGIGAWAGHVNASAEIDDSGLRAAAREDGGKFLLPNGVPFVTPGDASARNVVFVSQWDNYPDGVDIPLEGRARRLYLLMAGSTNHMQSRIDNGEVIVGYADGSTERLPLHNPTNWWPIEQDYFIDDYQFRRPGAIPPRVDLKTGRVRLLDTNDFKGNGRIVPGGAATVLVMELATGKELSSLSVRALANEVVIGLMAATLER